MDALSVLRGCLGVVTVLFLAVLFSNDRRAVPWRLVAVGMVLLVAFALFVLKVELGRQVLGWCGAAFVWLFSFAADGARFVFGRLAAAPGTPQSLGPFFAFQVLPTIIYFATLIAILYHLGVMQRVVQGIAWLMLRILRTSGAESLCVAANTFIGQTEAPLTIRPYLGRLTQSELFTVMTSGMAHIGGGVMAVYVQMLGAAAASGGRVPLDAAQVRFAMHFLAAVVMAAPATMIVAKIMYPEKEEPETRGTVRPVVGKTHANLIEAAAAGAGDGIRLAINVAGMLIAFIAVIALVDALLGGIGSMTGLNERTNAWFGKPLSLELVFGSFFRFVAWTIGVPWQDALDVGGLMGIKLALNEFVAYTRMAELVSSGALSEKASIITTYALCGFANFASIAIQIGGIGPLAENRRRDIARFGLRSVIGGTLATWLTASVAGMFV
ncbi:MAG: nucleoside transporter C-terminal domain-containing protein [Bacteroidota bacterium]|nr:nucleoside transporter C-terminal domain-containing protein [Bacteroidota bacterium]